MLTVQEIVILTLYATTQLGFSFYGKNEISLSSANLLLANINGREQAIVLCALDELTPEEKAAALRAQVYYLPLEYDGQLLLGEVTPENTVCCLFPIDSNRNKLDLDVQVIKAALSTSEDKLFTVFDSPILKWPSALQELDSYHDKQYLQSMRCLISLLYYLHKRVYGEVVVKNISAFISAEIPLIQDLLISFMSSLYKPKLLAISKEIRPSILQAWCPKINENNELFKALEKQDDVCAFLATGMVLDFASCFVLLGSYDEIDHASWVRIRKICLEAYDFCMASVQNLLSNNNSFSALFTNNEQLYQQLKSIRIIATKKWVDALYNDFIQWINFEQHAALREVIQLIEWDQIDLALAEATRRGQGLIPADKVRHVGKEWVQLKLLGRLAVEPIPAPLPVDDNSDVHVLLAAYQEKYNTAKQSLLKDKKHPILDWFCGVQYAKSLSDTLLALRHEAYRILMSKVTHQQDAQLALIWLRDAKQMTLFNEQRSLTIRGGVGRTQTVIDIDNEMARRLQYR